ncbi:putative F-box protein At3g16210 [Cucumis melo]|uniref:F-box protein At3g16210 n=1 Tax=Cucumis melo TaxID=3656 RepID=A0A1S3CB99_CUCME|nr:putative F-box protein At3g16210 [Cucumis melo]
MEILETKKRIPMNINLRLPPHIVRAIFSKLSISNLPTCRVVCKTWNNLVLEYASSTKFLPTTTLFLSMADEISNYIPFKSTPWCNPKIHCVDIDSKTSYVASFGFEGDWSYITIVNSCNGLLYICKFTFDSLCEGILNPMTNEFMEIPQPEIELDVHSIGFGFSPRTKQYKLFRTEPEVLENLKKCHYIMEIFTFDNGYKQWRHFERLPFVVFHHGQYLNGVIYWIGKKLEKEGEAVIYALDVDTEQMECTATLEIGPSLKNGSIKIFEERVYAIISLMDKRVSPISYKIELWRMQKKDSWIKEFSIDEESFGLITVLEDGELLVAIKDNIFRLDKSRKKIKIKTLNSSESRIKVIGCNTINSINFECFSNILARD